MKWFKTEYTGFTDKQNSMRGEGAGYGNGTPIEKTVGVLGGDAKWQFLNGMKVAVDPEGTIVRGPDILIGLEFDKVKNVPFMVLTDIAASTGRALNVTNNESYGPSERAAQKQYENAKIRLSKAIQEWNTSRYEKMSPGTTQY